MRRFWAVVLGLLLVAGCDWQGMAASTGLGDPIARAVAPAPSDPGAAKRAAARVLVTGFGRYDRYVDNPSTPVARAMEGKHDGVTWTSLGSLQVIYGSAAERVLRAANEQDADAVVVLGLFPGIEGVRVETIAENVARSSLRDELGEDRNGRIAIPGAPDTLDGTLTGDAIVRALVADGRYAYTSTDAGGFVCNDVFYRLLYAGREGRGPRHVVLIHVGDDAASDTRLPKQIALAVTAALRAPSDPPRLARAELRGQQP